MCRKAHPKVWCVSRGLPRGLEILTGGPGGAGRPNWRSGGVGRPTQRFGRGQEGSVRALGGPGGVGRPIRRSHRPTQRSG